MKKHIVYVEDDSTVRLPTTRMLQRMYPAHHVAGYSSSMEAIKALAFIIDEFTPEAVSLILSDLDLIGNDSGLDVLAFAKGESPLLASRFVFLSGNSHVEQLHDKVIHKPVSYAELQDQLRKFGMEA